eukprot:3938377-Rhodomonas_salina.2
MSGTERAYGATGAQQSGAEVVGCCPSVSVRSASHLRACYTIPGTDIAYGALSYTEPGTDRADGSAQAISLRDLQY